ncbi:MAG TPA: dienelactone hydrolase family protein [Actinomycetota bacterium]
MSGGPHEGGRVLHEGLPVREAGAAAILVHGRGATAESILGLAPLVDPGGFTFLAPQAAGHTWYPQRFMEPVEANEPWLSSALGVLSGLLDRLAGEGIRAERTVLLGFSQGACLALELAARNARRYGGLVGLSGGLIGPDGTPRRYPGSLDGTPVVLGCSDVDPHIPKRRVDETAEVLRRLGGEVEVRIYPGMGHTINDDELDAVRALFRAVAPVG